MSLENNSKLMSYILRHKPEKFNLTLDSEGYVNIDELVRATAADANALTRTMVFKIVAQDSKGRYQISEDEQMVRAVQGHSTKQVDIQYPIKIPPLRLYHGTELESVAAIRKKGIQPMNRQYVHLSIDFDVATEVGRRHGEPRILTVDCLEMVKAGIKFRLAPNGVWLVEEVAPQYIIDVQQP